MPSFRRERLASLIQQIIGEALLHHLEDPRIEALTSVSRVEVTGDLQIAKIYLTIPGDEAAERRTLTALRGARGYLQGMVARAITMRHCPELRFDPDQAAKIAKVTLNLIEQNRRREGRADEETPEGDRANPTEPDGPDSASDRVGHWNRESPPS